MINTYRALIDSNYLAQNLLDRIASTEIKDVNNQRVSFAQSGYDESPLQASQVTTSHDPNPANGSTRGNLTSVQKWLNTTGSSLSVSSVYYDTGMVQQTTDPNTNHNTFSYGSSFAGAYVTKACNALFQCAQYNYDLGSGQRVSVTDLNQATTSYQYDAIGRLLQISYPPTSGGQTVYLCYSDSGGVGCNKTGLPYTIVVTKAITSTLNETTMTVADGLGRTTSSQLTSDPISVTKVTTTYDALGRKSTVTNPYRSTSDSTYGVTTYQYDALSRVTQVAPPDGTVPTPGSTCLARNTCTTYSGNTTTVTDPTGRTRKSKADALGRLTEVWEDPANLNYQTLYQYDTLGNLTCVEQHGSAATGTGCSSPPSSDSTSPWRVRRFNYDSLSQLLSTTDPELGATSFQYDNDGNVKTKIAPKSNQTGAATVTTTYLYDALNRLAQKSYDDATTATVYYGYDGNTPSGCTPPSVTGATNLIGRRSSMCDASGAAAWSFDSSGRVLTEKRSLSTGGTNTVTETLGYTYNLDGSLAALTYPSGRVITYRPDATGRTVSAIDTVNGLNYVTSATYAPQGALSGYQNGASIYGRLTYNNRLQPLQAFYTSGALPSPSELQQPVCPTSAIPTIMGRVYLFQDPNSGNGNNGNADTISDCINSDRTKNFDYDNLNRIADAYTTGATSASTNWGEIYTIDAWGNLTNIGLKTGWRNSETMNTAATSQNHLVGFGYDAAGNLTSNGSVTYTYDAEGRLTATAGWTYVYDGDGKRVIKCSGTYPNCASATLYWNDMGSNTLAETSWTGAASYEYVFFNGKRLARREGTGNTVRYFFADHLGSTTVITSETAVIQKLSMYYPYGGEILVTGSSFASNYKFTGKERDAESGRDYFGARFYAPNLGRFESPDPIIVSTRRMLDPRQWNMYAYAGNNPLAYLDPGAFEAIVLGYFWRTDWLPTGEGFAAFDLLSAFGGADGAISMGEPGDSHGYFIVADITKDLFNSKQSTATISENLDPMTGQMGSSTRWWSDVSGGPVSEYSKIRIDTFTLSNLSDADLQAVATALEKASLQNGLDDALWEAELQVEIEIMRRKKLHEEEHHDPQDDNEGK
jgi:RHS repeat-associated protein